MEQPVRAAILGTGSSLPSQVLTNADLEKIVDTSDEWIVTRTGIRQRHVAGEDEPMSQFATEASRRALESAGTAPEELDLIICASVTPDRLIPSTSCFIQDKLGARRAAAFDLTAGCSGFVYALSVGAQFVASGKYRRVLVIGAELLTKYLDWQDRTTCVIFADGAGAVVLGPATDGRGIQSFGLHTDGSMADFITIPAGGTERPISKEVIDEREHLIHMRGNETFKIAVRSLTQVSRAVLEEAGASTEDVDLYIPHQANRRIINAVGERLKIPSDRVFVNIDRIGNTSAASIPIAMDEARRAGRLAEGHRVLLAAFGAGLTWAAAYLRF